MTGGEPRYTSDSTSWRSSPEAEQERILQQLLTEVSHDLRAPLTIINATACMLRLKVSGPDALALIEQIRSQVRRLDQMIEDMVTLNSLEVMRPDATYRLVNVNELAQTLYTDFATLAQEKALGFAMYPGEVQPVMGDPGSLLRACSAILTNAMLYSEPGGRVIVSTYLRDSWSIFEVADSGPGIAPEDLPHIFDRFFRAEQTPASTTSGIGLGLSIARRIVEYHRGSIEVESVPGTGSTFRVLLPTLARLLPEEA